METRLPVAGQRAEQKLDTTIGAYLFNGCWLVAGLGMAIVQMRLLAQAWQQSHLAVWTAGIAGSWTIGSVLISRLDTREQKTARLWGVGFVTCVLLWVRIPAAPGFGPARGVAELVVMAFLMGTLSTAWLAQRRPWPPVGERTRLCKGLVSTMVGLSLVWLLPAWAMWLGLLCLSPLLVLDCWPEARCPLPAPGKLIDTWDDLSDGEESLRLRLQRHPFRQGWWWSYLVRRGRAPLVLLASSVSGIVGGIWNAVPTPFAAHLFAIHTPAILVWLVASQFVALCLGAWGVVADRAVLGSSDRRIPQGWRKRAWSTAIICLLLLAGSLLALGMPGLQEPWLLAGSLAAYTLAAATWGILLPRLLPSFRTLVFSERHLLLRQGYEPRTGQLAYERAQEEQINRVLATAEGCLTAVLAVALGWLVDQWSVDRVLVMTGILLLIFLGIFCTAMGVSRQAYLFSRGKNDAH